MNGLQKYCQDNVLQPAFLEVDMANTEIIFVLGRLQFTFSFN